MTDFQTTMAIVFVGMAVMAAGLIAWGVSSMFDTSNKRRHPHAADPMDPVAEMQRKNLAAKHDHNSH
ncbi:MAG: hypothetical protein P1U88_02970 [Thalassobaculaceae bacterium]|nr:hypothetical protein [Thalassobaculaceae bacterium]